MNRVINSHTTELYKTTNAFNKVKGHFNKTKAFVDKLEHFEYSEADMSANERTSAHICAPSPLLKIVQPAAATCRTFAANVGSAFAPGPPQGARCFKAFFQQLNSPMSQMYKNGL